MGINGKTNELMDELAGVINGYAKELPPATIRLCLDNLRYQMVEVERLAVQQEQEREKAPEKKKGATHGPGEQV